MAQTKKNIEVGFLNKNFPVVACILLDDRQKTILILFLLATTFIILHLVCSAGSLESSTFLLVFIFIMLLMMNTSAFHRMMPLLFGVKSILTFTKNLESINLESFPRYSVIVPLYMEGCVVKQTINSLKNLKYPTHALEIFLVVEENDDDTLSAMPPIPDYMRIIHISNPMPRGKPYALNVALKYATGRYITIYDAEDIPDRYQLLKAARAFENYGEHVWAVQAKLIISNKKVNWLTKIFSSEYWFWFSVYLPYLEQQGYPVPLGGSSNHIRMDRLLEIGGWDSHNVTEDADLAIRIYKKGGKIKLLDSVTYETSPVTINNWVRQRTRWIKGLIQTFFVHSRSEISYSIIKYFIFCYSGIFMAAYCLLHAIVVTLYGAIFGMDVIMIICIIPFILNLILNAIIYKKGEKNVRTQSNCLLLPMIVLYWFLYLVANFRAFYQLITAPYLWEKTCHSSDS